MVLVGFVLLAISFCIGSVYGNNFHQFQVNLKCEISPPVIVYYHSTIIYMHTCYECSRYIQNDWNNNKNRASISY